jgi:Icc-related predicted phosphoesterase
MKFVAIADTHGKHDELELPPGDVLIHAGDMTMRGKESEVVDFLNWFQQQPFDHKVLIAGNHDFFFERAEDLIIKQFLPSNIIYLQDSSATINGIKLWGSPITPWFYNWAFNRERGEEIKQHWDLIPGDTDIIITHGPVFGILDETRDGRNVGCEDLLEKAKIIKPKVHICGHIHESYGTAEEDGIKFINASVLNARYELAHDPIVFEF